MVDSDQHEFLAKYQSTGNTLNIEEFVHNLYDNNRLLGKTASVDVRIAVNCYYATPEGETVNYPTEWSAYSNAIEYTSSNRILILPSALTTIESEAFAGVSAEIVVIPASVIRIAEDAFVGSNIRTIVGSTKYVRKYAEDHHMSFQEQ